MSKKAKFPPIKRIAINTGGGDAPGLNAVIRAVVIAAHKRGWECFGIRDAFSGLMSPELYPNGWITRLTPHDVHNITHIGGTIIGTSSHGNPRKFPTPLPDGTVIERDRTDEIFAAFKTQRLDALVAIGGDGSLTLANELSKKGLRVIGVPKTIDNDLDGTVLTFGFDTAADFATQSIDRLHATAAAHHRIMVVEVMGRYAGWIALHAGVAGAADAILIPELPYDIAKIADHLHARHSAGHQYSIVVVAEGAVPQGGTVSIIEAERAGNRVRLGGIGYKVGDELTKLTGRDVRVVRLGHLLRGGTPTSFDRLLSLRFGAAAVRALEEGESGIMVALAPPTVHYIPLAEATNRMKVVPLDCDTMLTARDLDICFGD
ncbi:MAG TPA: ATP-dependent 6-phosphofructokinase [Anaerolineae bacterium]|nr:ATP-dependent 6-phosphofructokinase [Anaerolineae bacterium]